MARAAVDTLFPERLVAGYQSFLGDRFRSEQARFRELAEIGQSPTTMVIGCCDSRVSPEVIFDAGPGELFVVRNVANLVPPYTPDGDYHGTSAALEFAVMSLKVSHIVVLGHAQCSGVRGFASNEVNPEGQPLSPGDFIGKWIKLIAPAYEALGSPKGDIGDFIEQPVKTYSSGMMMRLAFAVAVSVQPDILIVDEALSVGDVFFTQKCFQRIREIVHRGATLIFVSHDTGSVQNLCDRGLLLSQGKLIHDGAPEDCVSRYFNLHQPTAASAAGPVAAGHHAPVAPNLRTALVAADILPSAKSRHGDRKLELIAAAVLDGHGAATWDFELLHRATIRVLFKAHAPIALPSVGLQLHDRMGNLLFAAGNSQLRFPLPPLAAGEEIMLDFRVTLTAQAGLYTLSLDAAEADPTDLNVGTFHDRVGGLGPLSVAHHAAGVLPFYGAAQLPLEISYA